MAVMGGYGPAGTLVDVSVTERGEVYEAVHSFSTGLIHVTGLTVAGAYATGDAFGARGIIPVPQEGTISMATFLDYDDEGLNKEIVLFSAPFTATTDNDAFAPTDNDLRLCLGVISISTWYNFNANQVGIAYPALTYVAPTGQLFYQIVTRGADNIAANAAPSFFLVIV